MFCKTPVYMRRHLQVTIVAILAIEYVFRVLEKSRYHWQIVMTSQSLSVVDKTLNIWSQVLLIFKNYSMYTTGYQLSHITFCYLISFSLKMCRRVLSFTFTFYMLAQFKVATLSFTQGLLSFYLRLKIVFYKFANSLVKNYIIYNLIGSIKNTII